MKKIIIISVISLFIIPFLFFATACGNKKTLQSTEFEVLNSSYTYNEQTNTISLDFEDLQNINFQNSDFRFTNVYDDETTEVLKDDKYTFELSSLVSSMQANTNHTITFKHKKDEKVFYTLNLHINSIKIPMFSYNENMSFLYCSEDIDIISKLDELQPSGQKTVSELLEEGALNISSSSTRTAKNYNPNGYSITLNLTTSYEWTNSSERSVTIDWQIERIKIEIPNFQTEFEYDYDIVNGEMVGKEQGIDFEKIFEGFENYITYSGPRLGVDAFEYRKTCLVSIRTFYSLGYVLYDTETQTEYPTGYEVKWRINPKKLPTPTLKESSLTFSKPSMYIIGENKANLENFDEEFMEIDYSNSQPFASSVGEGKIRISLKEQYKNNFTFTPSTDENVEVVDDYVDNHFTVSKANFTPLAEVDFEKLELETFYTSSETLNSLNLISNEYNAWTDESWQYLKQLGFVTENANEKYRFEWSEENTSSVLSSGTYNNLKLKYYHYENNFNPYDLTVKLVVKKSPIDINTSVIFDSQIVDNKYTYSTFSAPIKITDNFENTISVYDELCSQVSISIIYKKTENSVSETHSFTLSEYKEIDLPSYLKNSGLYTLQIKIICDSDYEVSVDKSAYEPEAVIEYAFEIETFKTDISLDTVTNNLQQTNSYYETNDNGFYFKENQSVTLTLEEFSETNKNAYTLYYNLKTNEGFENATSLVKDFTKTTYFRQSAQNSWEEISNASQIGYYKDVYSFTPITDNVEISNAEFEWAIYSGNIVFETYSLEWDSQYNNKKYTTFAHEGPKMLNIPENVLKTKYEYFKYDSDIVGEALTPIDADRYASVFKIILPNDDSVSISFPLEMFSEEIIGNTKVYTYHRNTIWYIYEYILNPNEIKFELKQSSFYFDDEDKTVEFKVETYISSTALENSAAEFLKNSTLSGDYISQVIGEHVAKIILPVCDENSNFDYNYEEFAKTEGYTYSPSTNTITFELTWRIFG